MSVYYLYLNVRVPLRTEHLSRVFKMSGCLDSDWGEFGLKFEHFTATFLLDMMFYNENSHLNIFNILFLSRKSNCFHPDLFTTFSLQIFVLRATSCFILLNNLIKFEDTAISGYLSLA